MKKHERAHRRLGPCLLGLSFLLCVCVLLRDSSVLNCCPIYTPASCSADVIRVYIPPPDTTMHVMNTDLRGKSLKHVSISLLIDMHDKDKHLVLHQSFL